MGVHFMLENIICVASTNLSPYINLQEALLWGAQEVCCLQYMCVFSVSIAPVFLLE